MATVVGMSPRTGRAWRRVAVAASLTAAVVVGSPGVEPTAADCVSAEVAYTLLGSPETYLVPPGTCVVPTPFAQCLTLSPRAGEPGTVEVRATADLVCPD